MFDERFRDGREVRVAVDKGGALKFCRGGDEGIRVGDAPGQLLAQVEGGAGHFTGDGQSVRQQLVADGENLLTGVLVGNEFLKPKLELQPSDAADVKVVVIFLEYDRSWDIEFQG